MNPFPLLALDTSTQACSVALATEDQLFDLYELAEKIHTRRLLSMVDAILIKAKLTIGQIKVLSFGCGPGSFTGLRIACSVIQGLAFAGNKPVVPVSTLRALAQGAHREQACQKVVSILDARMGEYYWGNFELDSNGMMQLLGEEQLSARENIIVPAGYVEKTGSPQAKDMIPIACFEAELGKTLSVENITPTYIRNNVAKKMSE